MIQKVVLLYLTIQMVCSELYNEREGQNIKLFYLEMLGTQSDFDQTLSNLVFSWQNKVLYGSTELSMSLLRLSNNVISGMKSVSPGSNSKIFKSNFLQTLA